MYLIGTTIFPDFIKRRISELEISELGIGDAEMGSCVPTPSYGPWTTRPPLCASGNGGEQTQEAHHFWRRLAANGEVGAHFAIRTLYFASACLRVTNGAHRDRLRVTERVGRLFLLSVLAPFPALLAPPPSFPYARAAVALENHLAEPPSSHTALLPLLPSVQGPPQGGCFAYRPTCFVSLSRAVASPSTYAEAADEQDTNTHNTIGAGTALQHAHYGAFMRTARRLSYLGQRAANGEPTDGDARRLSAHCIIAERARYRAAGGSAT
ncbi:hypothetical protein HYPSUDRAFT_203036 [Hypholoma sublateritium FD-334 SS-4]|uniref:Uncharacterized protein n=1 Tax=Hypholoma sublateritium (strain FD-334 SS-4) TaxID=945553 RepID=A0A0D2NXR4_HYPSF|nr:hypothetical protein HYPSUDRAFT_203036 [Hypholoma sublateritium FD-334 SS-4]